jgi:hypothetical protein
MPRDPQSRLTDESAQPLQLEMPSGLVLEEVAEPSRKQNATDTDWLSMTTADPAFFLNDTGPE